MKKSFITFPTVQSPRVDDDREGSRLPPEVLPSGKSLHHSHRKRGGQAGGNFTNILRAAKVFCAAFMCLQFEFAIFWQKDFGAKVAHKMLVKLTPGVQVIHNLR